MTPRTFISVLALTLIAPVATLHAPVAAQDADSRAGTPGAVLALPDVPAAIMSGVDDVAAGDGYFATLKDGRVRLWLADPSMDGPIREWGVSSFLSTGVRSIDGGADHFLAIKGGGVTAFGPGGGTKMNPPAEARSGVTQARAGEQHSLALKNGGVIAWGSNSCGQRLVPADARSGVTTIRAAGENSLALKDGKVIAWGCISTVPEVLGSGVAQISAGTRINLALKNGRVYAWDDSGLKNVPKKFRSGVERISAGHEHFFAWKSGRPLAWGKDLAGETKIPATASATTNVSAGYFQTVALDGDGKVLIWGRGSHTQESVPTTMSSGVTAVAVGRDFSAAVKNGGVVVWGGKATRTDRVPAAAKSGVTAIAASTDAVVAIKNGAVITWGNGSAPPPAAASSGVTAVTAGASHFLALKGTTVLAWGANGGGQATIPVSAQTGIKGIAAGGNLSGAITSSGQLIVWGTSRSGRSEFIVPGAAASGVRQADTDGEGWVIRKGNSALLWSTRSTTPVSPSIFATGVSAVTASHSTNYFLSNTFTVAVVKDGRVIRWTPKGGVLPTPQSAASKVVAIDSAFGRSLAIRTP